MESPSKKYRVQLERHCGHCSEMVPPGSNAVCPFSEHKEASLCRPDCLKSKKDVCAYGDCTVLASCDWSRNCCLQPEDLCGGAETQHYAPQRPRICMRCTKWFCAEHVVNTCTASCQADARCCGQGFVCLVCHDPAAHPPQKDQSDEFDWASYVRQGHPELTDAEAKQMAERILHLCQSEALPEAS